MSKLAFYMFFIIGSLSCVQVFADDIRCPDAGIIRKNADTLIEIGGAGPGWTVYSNIFIYANDNKYWQLSVDGLVYDKSEVIKIAREKASTAMQEDIYPYNESDGLYCHYYSENYIPDITFFSPSENGKK